MPRGHFEVLNLGSQSIHTKHDVKQMIRRLRHGDRIRNGSGRNLAEAIRCEDDARGREQHNSATVQPNVHAGIIYVGFSSKKGKPEGGDIDDKVRNIQREQSLARIIHKFSARSGAVSVATGFRV
jgi:hypothetical protein